MPEELLPPPPPKRTTANTGGEELLPPPPPKKKSSQSSSTDASDTSIPSENGGGQSPSGNPFVQAIKTGTKQVLENTPAPTQTTQQQTQDNNTPELSVSGGVGAGSAGTYIKNQPKSDFEKYDANKYLNKAQEVLGNTSKALKDVGNAAGAVSPMLYFAHYPVDALQGIVKGSQRIVNSTNALQTTAGAVQTAFSGASLVVPELMAFNAGLGEAEKVLPEKVMSYAMSPFQTILQDTGGYINVSGFPIKFIDAENPTVQAGAELLDLGVQILEFKGFHEIAKKVKENIPLTPDESTQAITQIQQYAKDYKPNGITAKTLEKIPSGLSDEQTVKTAPIVAEKQDLEQQQFDLMAQKGTTDSAFHPEIDKKIEGVKSQIDKSTKDIAYELDSKNKTEPIISQPTPEGGISDAIQEQSAGSVLQHTQETVAETGGERQRVEPIEQGEEIATTRTEEGGTKNEIAKPDLTQEQWNARHKKLQDSIGDSEAMTPEQAKENDYLSNQLELLKQEGGIENVQKETIQTEEAKNDVLNQTPTEEGAPVSPLTSVLNQKTDLKGNTKENWMTPATEKELKWREKVEGNPYKNTPARIVAIKDAVSKGRFLDAIKEEKLSANDAATIIESAGLEVPREIKDFVKSEIEKVNQEPVNQIGSISTKGKEIADRFRKTFKSKPLILKDKNGNIIEADIHTKSFYDDAVEAIALSIEKGADIAQAIKDHLDKQEWFKSRSEEDKKAIEKQFNEHFKDAKTQSSENTKMANAVRDAHIEGKYGAKALDEIITKLQDTDTKKIYESVKEKIESGAINPAEVRKRLIETKTGSEKDQAILTYDAAELDARERKIRKQIISETDISEQGKYQDELLRIQNDMMDNALANRVIGRSASNLFRLRQLWVDKNVNLVDMIEEYKAAKGYDKLTEEQNTYIKSAYNRLHEMELKMEELRQREAVSAEENRRLKEENEILKKLSETAKEQRKTDRAIKSDDAISKSNERIKKSKDNLKKLGGELNTGVNPKIAIEIGKIAAEKVYQGIVKFDEVIKNVWDEIKDILPKFSEEDVRRHLEYIKNKPVPESSRILQKIKQTARVIGKIERKDFNPKERVSLEKSEALKEAESDYAKARFEWDKGRRQDLMAHKPIGEKIKDNILRWQRFAVLSYPSTLAKLAFVVGHGMVFKPFRALYQAAGHYGTKGLESGVNALYKGLGSNKEFNITGKQSIYGKPRLSSLAKFYGAFYRNFSVANLKEYFKGLDPLEAQYGEPLNYNDYKSAQWLDMPGRSHGYIKSFIKKPEFEYANNQIIQHYLDKTAQIEESLQNYNLSDQQKISLQKEKEKYDVTNEQVRDIIGRMSLEHGKWSILMNENNIAQKAKESFNKWGVLGTFAHSELPILKIPLNYIDRAFATKYGLIMALTGKGWGATKYPGLIKLMLKGTKELTEQEANLLGRTVQQGTIGVSLFALGYLLQKNAKREKDDKGWDINGVSIPDLALHYPEYESFFNGLETAQKFQDNKSNGFKYIQDMVDADADIAKKNPFYNMLQYGFISKLYTASKTKSEEKMWNQVVDSFGQKLADMSIPGFIKQSAPLTSNDTKGYYRKAQGDAADILWQDFEKNLPFLRGNVKEKKINKKD